MACWFEPVAGFATVEAFEVVVDSSIGPLFPNLLQKNRSRVSVRPSARLVA